MLVYPVITFTEPYCHTGSRKNLLGENPDPKLVENLSNERQVTKDTPPIFLVHGSNDDGVPVENSLAFYAGCRKAKVPVEMHLYVHGPHGFGLGNRDNMAAGSWPKLWERWLREIVRYPRTRRSDRRRPAAAPPQNWTHDPLAGARGRTYDFDEIQKERCVTMARFALAFALAGVTLGFFVAGCSPQAAAIDPSNTAALAGQDVYNNSCASCHSVAFIQNHENSLVTNLGSLDSRMSSITLTEEQLTNLKAFLATQ